MAEMVIVTAALPNTGGLRGCCGLVPASTHEPGGMDLLLIRVAILAAKHSGRNPHQVGPRWRHTMILFVVEEQYGVVLIYCFAHGTSRITWDQRDRVQTHAQLEPTHMLVTSLGLPMSSGMITQVLQL